MKRPSESSNGADGYFDADIEAHPLTQEELDHLERLHCRKPGLFERVTAWGIMHFGVLMGVSLVGWLLFLAALALMLLPGCSQPQVDQRERQAFTAFEKLIVAETADLVAGRVTQAQFVSDLRMALDALQSAEQGERANQGTSWLEVVGTALGSSTLVGGALHVLRNSTRKRDLDDATTELNDRVDALEVRAKGGAA